MDEDVQMSQESQLDGEYIFVRTEETRLILFDKAVQACEDAQLQIKTLSPKECLAYKPSKGCQCIYVVDNFQQDILKLLNYQGAKVYGAACLLHCIQRNESLPLKSPVYSLCLKGAVVSVTGLKKDKRAEAEKAIQWLGGEFTGALVKSTTHLIARETSSKKYQTAGQIGIPILSEDWLAACILQSKTQIFDATAPSFLQDYLFPVFSGCTISTSGIPDRERIKQLVINNGGTYTGQMNVATCTHLVIEEPKGPKYKAAINWASVLIVRPPWIYDSIKAGYRLNEGDDKYTLREASTPEKNAAPLELNDVSAILSQTAFSHVDMTLNSTARRSDDTLRSELMRRSNETHGSRGLKGGEGDSMCDALKDLKICLRGFTDAVTDNLTQVISLCSGTRVQSVVAADYIVVSNMDDQTREHMKNISAPVVSLEWLQQIGRSRHFLEPDPYILTTQPSNTNSSADNRKHKTSSSSSVMLKHVSTSSMGTTSTSVANERLSTIGQTRTSSKRSAASTLDGPADPDTTQMNVSVNQLDAEAFEADDFMSQYSQNAEFLPPISKKPRRSSLSPPVVSHPSASRRSDPKTPSTDLAQLHLETPGERNAPPTPALPPGSFNGKRFFVLADTNKATISIRLLGGVVVWTESNDSDYTITPVCLSTAVKSSSPQLTTHWVEACERERTFLSPDLSRLFRPIVIPEGCQIFDGFMFTTTKLTTYDRTALADIIKRAGGNYSDEMRREKVGELGKTTHLITESRDSEKYKAALVWKIPVITIRFISESIEANKLMSVEDYGVDKADAPKKPAKLTSTTPAATSRPSAQIPRPSHSSNDKRTPNLSETPLHSRVQSLRGKGRGSSSSQRKSRPALDFLSTSLCENPDQSFHPQFEMAETPEQSRAEHNVHTPMSDSLSTNLMLAARRHAVVTPVTPDSLAHALHGVSVYISPRVAGRPALRQHAVEIGAELNETLDASSTHVILQDNSVSDPEYRTAVKYKQFIVSPEWIHACQKAKKRVPEGPYRCDTKPTDAASSAHTDYTPIRVGVSSRLNAAQRRDNLGEGSQGQPTENTLKDTESQENSLNEVMHMYKRFRSYLQNKKDTDEKDTSSGENLASEGRSAPSPSLDSSKHGTLATRHKLIANETATLTTETQASQVAALLVTWNDTTSKTEQEKMEELSGMGSDILEQMGQEDLTEEEQRDGIPLGTVARAGQEVDDDFINQMDDDENFTQEMERQREKHIPKPAADCTADYTEVSLNTETEDPPAAPPRPPAVFQLSDFDAAERDALTSQLEALGHEVVVSPLFDSRCTHIILCKPNRNEKFLSALIKGLWVLHKSFVTSSTVAGHLVNEGDHEWGGNGTRSLYKPSTTVATYAAAARRWRQAKHENMSQGRHDGVFESWSVMLFISDGGKLQGLKRLLELGGAAILPSQVDGVDKTAVTHIFIDVKRSSLKREELTTLCNTSIPCLKPEFIPCYLIDEVIPSVTDTKFNLSTQYSTNKSMSTRTRRSQHPS